MTGGNFLSSVFLRKNFYVWQKFQQLSLLFSSKRSSTLPHQFRQPATVGRDPVHIHIGHAEQQAGRPGRL
jgi:hypothetical protein